MSHLNKTALIFFLIVSACASDEQLWKGSIEDFTSNYVEEIRRIDVRGKSTHVNEVLPLLSVALFEPAEAKDKSRRAKAKPLILKTKAVRRIQKKQAKRMYDLDGYKAKKNIGEKEDGLIGIRTLKGLSKKEQKKVKSLVEKENKDREALYAIIVKSSQYSKAMEVVLRKSFFDSYQEWSPVGTFYYKDQKWQKK